MQTLFTGRNIINLYEVDSTNAYAQNLVKTGTPAEGTVIIAEHQAQGRGQRGTAWQTEPGKNLTCSIILKPGFLAPRDTFMLNKMASLAVFDFLSYYPVADISVKWPNDVYVYGKKIAGILIENTWRESILAWSIVGIGININQTAFGEFDATSLKAATGNDYDIDDCLQQLCKCLEARYLQLRSDRNNIDREYKENLFGLGEKRRFMVNNREITGMIKGVNRAGELVLETGEMLLHCDLKEVVFLR